MVSGMDDTLIQSLRCYVFLTKQCKATPVDLIPVTHHCVSYMKEASCVMPEKMVGQRPQLHSLRLKASRHWTSNPYLFH